MGRWVSWNLYPDPPDDTVDEHERAHMRACRGRATPYRWVRRPGTGWVVEGTIDHGIRGLFDAAVTLMTGALAGGGDASDYLRAVEGLVRESRGRFSLAEVTDAAREYV
jgi:hypothetical protein